MEKATAGPVDVGGGIRAESAVAREYGAAVDVSQAVVECFFQGFPFLLVSTRILEAMGTVEPIPEMPFLTSARAERVRYADEEYHGRGPVYVSFEGREYGPLEINHVSRSDPNLCTSLVEVEKGRRYVRVTYDLRQVAGLGRDSLPYLKYDGEQWSYTRR